MTDAPTPHDDRPADIGEWLGATMKNVQVVYGLYLLNFILPFTSIVGVIFAYINRDKASELAYGHYQYQIRTFWIALLYAVICMVLTIVFIGILGFFALAIWWLVRNIKGFMAASKSEPIANPQSWLF